MKIPNLSNKIYPIINNVTFKKEANSFKTLFNKENLKFLRTTWTSLNLLLLCQRLLKPCSERYRAPLWRHHRESGPPLSLVPRRSIRSVCMTLHYFHIIQACLKVIINNNFFDARSVSDYISSIRVQKVLLLKKLKSIL